jgi:hypothetical protein
VSGSDLLANAERPPSDRPSPVPEEPTPAGYWHGSAHDEIERWRDRALRAEAMVERLHAALRAWRPHT